MWRWFVWYRNKAVKRAGGRVDVLWNLDVGWTLVLIRMGLMGACWGKVECQTSFEWSTTVKVWVNGRADSLCLTMEPFSSPNKALSDTILPIVQSESMSWFIQWWCLIQTKKLMEKPWLLLQKWPVQCVLCCVPMGWSWRASYLQLDNALTVGSCLTWSYSDNHFGWSFHGVHSPCLSIEVYHPWLMMWSKGYCRSVLFRYNLGLSYGGAPLRFSQQHCQYLDYRFLIERVGCWSLTISLDFLNVSFFIWTIVDSFSLINVSQGDVTHLALVQLYFWDLGAVMSMMGRFFGCAFIILLSSLLQLTETSCMVIIQRREAQTMEIHQLHIRVQGWMGSTAVHLGISRTEYPDGRDTCPTHEWQL